jgi:hypothetical protein
MHLPGAGRSLKAGESGGPGGQGLLDGVTYPSRMGHPVEGPLCRSLLLVGDGLASFRFKRPLVFAAYRVHVNELPRWADVRSRSPRPAPVANRRLGVCRRHQTLWARPVGEDEPKIAIQDLDPLRDKQETPPKRG